MVQATDAERLRLQHELEQRKQAEKADGLTPPAVAADDLTSARRTGYVKNATGSPAFTSGRWGFIRDRDDKDWFFHEMDLEGREWPREGDLVSFLPSTEKKRGKNDRAVRVVLLLRPEPCG